MVEFNRVTGWSLFPGATEPADSQKRLRLAIMMIMVMIMIIMIMMPTS